MSNNEWLHLIKIIQYNLNKKRTFTRSRRGRPRWWHIRCLRARYTYWWGLVWSGDARHFADACSRIRRHEGDDIVHSTMIGTILNEQMVIKDTHELHEDDHEACSYDWYDKDSDDDYLSSGAHARDSADDDFWRNSHSTSSSSSRRWRWTTASKFPSAVTCQHGQRHRATCCGPHTRSSCSCFLSTPLTGQQSTPGQSGATSTRTFSAFLPVGQRQRTRSTTYVCQA